MLIEMKINFLFTLSECLSKLLAFTLPVRQTPKFHQFYYLDNFRECQFSKTPATATQICSF